MDDSHEIVREEGKGFGPRKKARSEGEVSIPHSPRILQVMSPKQGDEMDESPQQASGSGELPVSSAGMAGNLLPAGRQEGQPEQFALTPTAVAGPHAAGPRDLPLVRELQELMDSLNPDDHNQPEQVVAVAAQRVDVFSRDTLAVAEDRVAGATWVHQFVRDEVYAELRAYGLRLRECARERWQQGVAELRVALDNEQRVRQERFDGAQRQLLDAWQRVHRHARHEVQEANHAEMVAVARVQQGFTTHLRREEESMYMRLRASEWQLQQQAQQAAEQVGGSACEKSSDGLSKFVAGASRTGMER